MNRREVTYNGRRSKISTRHCGGVVLVIVLLAALLLAGLVLFVINQGRHVNARLVTQHSADTAATSGAASVARAFNTVAMNNVAMSRHIPLINMLDSLPIVTQAARVEQTAFRDALAQRIGSINFAPAALESVAAEEFTKLLDELEDEVAALEPLDDFFTSTYNVTQMTHFNSGDGLIWQAMRSLDETSAMVMENLADSVQRDAVSSGEVNLWLDQAGDGSAVLVPVVTQVPWRRGRFDDFEAPVKLGLLPGEHSGLVTSPSMVVDDKYTNRGPYDTVFGWRRLRREAGLGGDGEPPTVGGVSGGGGNPFGGGPRNVGGGGGEPGDIISYNTYGTQRWTQDLVIGYVRNYLYFSRFARWAVDSSNVKLAYVWPGGDTWEFALPLWQIQYPVDIPLDPDQPLAFSESCWLRLDIKSRYPRLHGSFMTAGSWAFIDTPESRHRTRARVGVGRGWPLPTYTIQLPDGSSVRRRMIDPTEIPVYQPNVTVDQAGALTWLYEYEYEVLFDGEIGIDPLLNADDQMQPQAAYFIQVVMYAGVNRNLWPAGVINPAETPDIGGQDPPQPSDIAAIENPYDGFERSAEDAPAPVDFDHTQIDASEDNRRRYLTFLGIARRNDRALLWPDRFGGGKPYPGIVGIAQAQVFNNHSWDLWTQTWHAQLQNVQHYNDWLTRIDDSLADAGDSTLVSEDELDELRRYLTSIESLEDLMLAH